jgi:hypothetical protein
MCVTLNEFVHLKQRIGSALRTSNRKKIVHLIGKRQYITVLDEGQRVQLPLPSSQLLFVDDGILRHRACSRMLHRTFPVSCEPTADRDAA